MPTLTITKNYAADVILTKAQLDAAYDSITTFINTTKLDVNNIQAGGVEGTNLATNCADGTSLEVSSNVLQIKALGVDTAELAANAVTTAKITALNVTRAKLEALGQQVSSASGNNAIASTSYGSALVSVTITTTGRPVFVALISDGTEGTQLVSDWGSDDSSMFVRLRRDSTDIAFWRTTGIISGSASGNQSFAGLPMHIDVVSSGTYVYAMAARQQNSNDGCDFNRVKLVAFEL